VARSRKVTPTRGKQAGYLAWRIDFPRGSLPQDIPGGFYKAGAHCLCSQTAARSDAKRFLDWEQIPHIAQAYPISPNDLQKLRFMQKIIDPEIAEVYSCKS
jgi:hypothetical protein